MKCINLIFLSFVIVADCFVFETKLFIITLALITDYFVETALV